MLKFPHMKVTQMATLWKFLFKTFKKNAKVHDGKFKINK